MKKENWINHLIESSTQIKDADPNPFLFDRIQEKIQNEQTIKSNIKPMVIQWSVAASILILLNISAIVFKQRYSHSFHKEDAVVKTISTSFENSTTYNY